MSDGARSGTQGGRETATICGSTFSDWSAPDHFCHLDRGHDGPHECGEDDECDTEWPCDATWPNESDSGS